MSTETVVHNTGAHDIPKGFGIHPYLHCPMSGTLWILAQQRWELAVDGPYNLRQPQDVTSLVLDDIYTALIADTDRPVRCSLQDQQYCIKTTVAFDAAHFPYVVVYTPPAPRQATCIEPYTWLTDELNLRECGVESNLVVLQPEETCHFLVSIATYKGRS